jgi:NAD-dependent SIR2 family protein deacetylase
MDKVEGWQSLAWLGNMVRCRGCRYQTDRSKEGKAPMKIRPECPKCGADLIVSPGFMACEVCDFEELEPLDDKDDLTRSSQAWQELLK